MLGTFAGYFVLEAFSAIPAPSAADPSLSFLNAYPVIALLLTFIAGAGTSALVGFLLEKIAYRPLRGAPRLVPLISAIGASIFLQTLPSYYLGLNAANMLTPIFSGAGRVG